MRGDSSGHGGDGEARWLSLARRTGVRVEGVLERISRQFGNRLHPEKPLHILPYAGFGTPDRATVRGRVLAWREPPSTDPDTLWGALQHSYRRFDTREVPGITVQAQLDTETAEAVTDEEGYFRLAFKPPSTAGHGQTKVVLELPERPSEYSRTEARLTIPPARALYGIISDIDDTVLLTEATSLVQMMRLTLLESSRTRVAFPGVSAFYSALHQGINPFFYVSSSPWNLYEFLDDFLTINDVVRGPMLLRDFGLDRDKFIAGAHHTHKLRSNREILDTYPNLPFVLIGDSGQDDPEIYIEILRQYPGRIAAIYIRDVSGHVRDRKVQQLMQEALSKGVDMLLIPDLLAAARHASAHGLIDEAALPSVIEAVSRDHQPLPGE